MARRSWVTTVLNIPAGFTIVRLRPTLLDSTGYGFLKLMSKLNDRIAKRLGG